LIKADVNSLKPGKEPTEKERAIESSREQIETGGRGFDGDI
jgi:hypothetical protein